MQISSSYLALIVGAALALGYPASAAAERYALILEGEPVGLQMVDAKNRRAALASSSSEARRRVQKAQENLRSTLRSRDITTTGALQTLVNAVFVSSTPEQAVELRTLPGVVAVVPMQPLRRSMNMAVLAANTAPAWAAVGGASNAGAGVKIAILDTGIDETHPAFQDLSLTIPAGYPKFGSADDATHASNKIIAVRSFVSLLAAGDNTPESSRPDDLSARDRVGHGTAVAMISAGASHTSPLGMISGIAPKAWLGNYKIYGSPGINDSTTADVVLQALEAAFNDGMDVAVVSAGALPAMWASDDQGAMCNNRVGDACDPWAAAMAVANRGGMTVVTPAGNSGRYGSGTIDTPGHVPGVITVGASTNAHAIASSAEAGNGQAFAMRLADGPKLTSSLHAPLKSISLIDATEHACLPLPSGSLTGAIAIIARGDLVTRGNCGYSTKVKNAQAAGAVAVLIFREPGGTSLSAPVGLSNTGIPAALISSESGEALKAYVAGNPGAVITLKSEFSEVTATTAAVADFSGRGPGISGSAIKPEFVAPGAGIYTAAQRYDPNGDLYSADGYIGVDGTSFAAAVAAGAAALVKQAHPEYLPAQIKSALTNTATDGLTESEGGVVRAARIVTSGAGKLNIGAAVTSNLLVEPPTISLGIVRSGVISKVLRLTNTGLNRASFSVASSGGQNVRLTPSSVALQPGESGDVTVEFTLQPGAGSHEGFINVTGGSVPVRVPYLYIVPDGVPHTLIPLTGDDFVTEQGTAVHLAFKAMDRFGAPVSSTQVRFGPQTAVHGATPATDAKGIAEAYVYTTAQVGEQSFVAQLQGASGIEFRGRTRARPEIGTGGVRNVDGSASAAGYAPGSYITVYGAGLSESPSTFRTPYLPISMAGVSVSFDAPESGLQVPGRVVYVSDTQVNVQIPWELEGAKSAILKLTISNSSSRNIRPDNPLLGTFRSQVITIPIAQQSPAFFQYQDAASGTMLAAAVDDKGQLLGHSNPTRAGGVIALYLNGLGSVADGTRPATGEATQAAPLPWTKLSPAVTIGGRTAAVIFSGLSPQSIGLYQVNIIVPEGLPSGVQTMKLSLGESSAQTALVIQ